MHVLYKLFSVYKVRWRNSAVLAEVTDSLEADAVVSFEALELQDFELHGGSYESVEGARLGNEMREFVEDQSKIGPECCG